MTAPTYAMGLIKEDYTAPQFRIPGSIMYKSVMKQELPSSFDTRLSTVFPVRNQEQQGSCAAFSAAEVSQNLEYYGTTSKLRELLSPQYIYNCRPNDGEGMEYSGVQQVLQECGVVREVVYPYGKEICSRNEMPQSIIERGQRHEMRQFVHINSIAELKAAMVHHKAGVMIAFAVYNFGLEFFKQHPGEELQGYQSVVAVAYDDDKQEITIQNSWGPDWGNKGFTVLSYKDFEKHTQIATLSFVDIKGPSFEDKPNLFWRLMGY